ncbi:hypothetical protein AQJ11_13605 [Streptomyces corchorusii]|uniref:Uncharacterized protein n=2 Tax=Streptomyces TaxID=1883 RepID=A0A101QD76_STRCK|nr:hypothetical protein [Streptomyces corchorusii]KUN27665.1 hypothetical protein AQJ11_13605 [Streptomyces corchorusii]
MPSTEFGAQRNVGEDGRWQEAGGGLADDRIAVVVEVRGQGVASKAWTPALGRGVDDGDLDGRARERTPCP